MPSRNALIGAILFIIYLALYGGFVILTAFAPSVMEITPLAGVNLAILYGFGLILAALLVLHRLHLLTRIPLHLKKVMPPVFSLQRFRLLSRLCLQSPLRQRLRERKLENRFPLPSWTLLLALVVQNR